MPAFRAARQAAIRSPLRSPCRPRGATAIVAKTLRERRLPELGFLATSFGAWGAALLSLIGLFLRLFWGVNKDEGRGRWVAWLRHDGFARRYREILNAGLDRIDRHLSPDFPQVPTDHAANRKTEPARAWSAPLLDLCLLLAVAYPILAVFADWTLRGEALEVGGRSLLPAGVEYWSRWFSAASLLLAAVLAMLAHFVSVSRSRRLLQIVAFFFASIFAGGFAVAGIPPFALTVAFAGAATFAAAFSVVFRRGAVLVAGAIAFTLASGEAFVTDIAFAILGMFVVSGAFVQNWIGQGLRRPALSLLGFSILLFALLWTVTALQDSASLDPDALTFILFLGFLPLLNAWADFASIGLTRWRLRIGVQHNLVANALIDGLAALLILIALASAMVATMHLVRTADGVPLYDAAALLADLRARPENYWWLAFMLFSTLLPTLAHLAIGAFALFTLVSGWLGRPIAAGLMKGDSPEGRIASLALSIAAALAVWLPCLLLWLGLKHGGAPLLDALLWSCERFLALLQASFPIRAAG